MSLIKVLHITFDMRVGGAERVIYNLVENTDRSKYDVSILCLDQPIGPFGLRLKEKGYQIDALRRKQGLDFSLIKTVRDYVIAHNINVLHCHQYTPYIYGLFSSIFTPAKAIFTEHGRFYPDRRRMKRIFFNPILARLTPSITSISSATKEALVRYENIPGNRVRVIYNGIEDSNHTRLKSASDVKRSWGIGERGFVLGTVARLDSIKNHPLMIRALKRILEKYPETFLIIVGDGPERKGLEELTSELGIEGQVIFTGFQEDTHLFYGIMDIFLLTSFSEGTAMTLLEAMAAGLPCIVTNVGGNPEIVKGGETGFIIPREDEEALSDKICTVLGDNALRKKMGQAARKRFEERFTVEKMVKAYEKIYDEIAMSRKL